MQILCDANPTYLSCDLGYGSRVIAWAEAQIITRNFGGVVVIPEDEWIEHIFLELPNTQVMSRHDINKLEWTDIDKDNGQEDWSVTDNWRINRSISSYIWNTHEFDIKYDDPIKHIKFKIPELNQFIERIRFDITFHLRRWSGVPILKKDLKTVHAALPRHVRNKYFSWMYKNNMIVNDYADITPNTEYPPFIPDKQYYEVIEYVMKELPDYDWYLMSDMPSELYDYYLGKYNFNSKEEDVSKWLQLLSKHYDLKKMTQLGGLTHRDLMQRQVRYGHALIDLLDWFVCSKSKLILSSYNSQFTDTAARLGGCECYRIGYQDMDQLRYIVLDLLTKDGQKH